MKIIQFFLVMCFSLSLVACNFPTITEEIPCGDVTKLIVAINNANKNPSVEVVINLAQDCTYILASINNFTDGRNGLPSIASNIVINGNSATIMRSMGGGIHRFRLFHISESGKLTINNLTLKNGYASDDGPFDNLGGAILNRGHAEVNDSLITENQRPIYNLSPGYLVILRSTISHNSDTYLAGIFNEGKAIIMQSTLTENGPGKTIQNTIGGLLEITNTTISGNPVSAAHRVIDADGGAAAFRFVTFANNGGVAIGGVSGSVTIENTIFGPSLAKSCYDPTNIISSVGLNMDTDGTCGVTTVSPNILMLAPLAGNGGPTLTHALLEGSIAIDTVEGACPAIDQRGIQRPQGGGCDIGAFEIEGVFAKPAATRPQTPKFTVEPCTYTSSVNLFCRIGPGSSIYPIIDSFTPDQSSPVIGISPDGFFVQVEGINSNVPCYIPLDEEFGTLSGYCDDLPVLIPPPTPTFAPSFTPSPTPPTRGCTVRQPGGTIICVSPCPVGASPGETCTMP